MMCHSSLSYSKGLSALEFFARNDVVKRFFEEERFIHVYGKVRENAIADPAPFKRGLVEPATARPSAPFFRDTTALFDTIYEASKGIRTIAPGEKKTEEPAIERAKHAIEDANCVYILGYGFDENNNKLLGLFDSLDLDKTNKVVLFTNFNDHNIVNKKASRVFFGNRQPDRLLANKPAIIGNQLDGYMCEKSIRNVYDALALDFDSPEEQLLSTTPF